MTDNIEETMPEKAEKAFSRYETEQERKKADALDALLADKRYKHGRALAVFGIAGSAAAFIVLLILKLSGIVFVWSEKAYFHSYAGLVPFLFAAFVGSFICRSRCITYGMPRRNEVLYRILTIVSGLMSVVLIFYSGVLKNRYDSYDVTLLEEVQGERVAVIEHPIRVSGDDNSFYEIYSVHGAFAKNSGYILGKITEDITYSFPDGYTVKYKTAYPDRTEYYTQYIKYE